MSVSVTHCQLTSCINLIIENKIHGFDFLPFFDKDRPSKIKSGILTIENNKYFLKFFYDNFSQSDFIRLKNFSLLFPTPKILDSILGKNKTTVLVYEYIQAKEKNGFVYVGYDRDIHKRNKITQFFNKLSHLYLKNIESSEKTDNYPSATFFEDRLFKGRAVNFYQNDYLLLLQDISRLAPDLLDSISESIATVIEYFKSDSITLTTLSHGDLYDFNYSYDWLFWDLDQCGINPILCDISICFWFLSSQRLLLMKYNPIFIKNNSSLTGPINLVDAKLTFDVFFDKLFLPTVAECSKYFERRKEFVSRMFCRCFLVSNVLGYIKEDKVFIYKMWNWLFEWYKQKKDIKSLKEIPTVTNF